MKRVIALRGLGNSGKSSTLRMMYELLVTRYALDRKRGKRVRVSIEGDINDVNTSVIVSVNGVRVGITSVGDQPGVLEGNLREFEFRGCAIIVCASRTAARFESVVTDLQRSCYEIEWIDKHKEGDTKTDWDAANMKVAEDIFTKIQNLL
ncbi:MAG TPA: hypothetical protein DC047_06740 [Blastocatellia bacterium]|nr:hypothetical protein [Blastocatellia bacterium]